MVDTLAELLRRSNMDVGTLTTAINTLSRSAMMAGSVVTVSIATGESSGTVRHTLGRPMTGAIVIGVSDTTQIPSVATPSGTGLTVTVDLNTPVADDTTVNLWVF